MLYTELSVATSKSQIDTVS